MAIDKEALKIRMAEAEEAYHKLMIGVKEVSVNVGNFGSVSYNQTSRAELAAYISNYISNLKSQLAIVEGKPFGKRRIMKINF